MVEITCAEKIRSKMGSLTNTEQKIAEYVLNNYEKVLTSNISELSENAEVSDASVVRFCKSLGYKGYQDFKISAARDVLPKDRHFNPVLEKGDDDQTLCNKVFGTNINVLRGTLAILDIKKMAAVAEMLAEAKSITFFGSGGSLLVGKDTQHKLLKIGIRSFVYEDADMQLMASALLGPDDLAFCISHSGSSSNVMKCMEIAKGKNAKTVALVSQEKTPLSKLADVSIFCASEETIFKSEAVSTRIAQLAIMDALVAMAAFRDYDLSFQSIQETRKATSQNKF
ncbi:MurR/RpiR family transcriptional regulator [Anaerotalea alkaliphila]|uniref:MurR/RpiR family transcriptional regulator n=1 Tax=Anaerotalea alkaliphila TaxID=2662126 RepID=A0A7X5HVS4_9FIRM|nr:MurR/RpiR family transcriptional regulator [Anaerotalea alkaliphila]NDL67566.1 MurR/RpiR family transcriptional regulator [Anaerotalea alkaliphila]